MKFRLIVLLVCLSLAFSSVAWAESQVTQAVKTPKKTEAVKSQPQKKGVQKEAAAEDTASEDEKMVFPENPIGKTRVMVEHQGEDRIGMALCHKIKEAVTASKRYVLSGVVENILIIRVSTMSELKDRPWFGTAYSLTWTFAENPEVLPYYLDGRLGTLGAEQTVITADAILETTDQVVSKYSYLFENQ